MMEVCWLRYLPRLRHQAVLAADRHRQDAGCVCQRLRGRSSGACGCGRSGRGGAPGRRRRRHGVSNEGLRRAAFRPHRLRSSCWLGLRLRALRSMGLASRLGLPAGAGRLASSCCRPPCGRLLRAALLLGSGDGVLEVDADPAWHLSDNACGFPTCVLLVVCRRRGLPRRCGRNARRRRIGDAGALREAARPGVGVAPQRVREASCRRCEGVDPVGLRRQLSLRLSSCRTSGFGVGPRSSYPPFEVSVVPPRDLQRFAGRSPARLGALDVGAQQRRLILELLPSSPLAHELALRLLRGLRSFVGSPPLLGAPRLQVRGPRLRRLQPRLHLGELRLVPGAALTRLTQLAPEAFHGSLEGRQAVLLRAQVDLRRLLLALQLAMLRPQRFQLLPV
mmetsp:Transcript_80674/g.233949  ORF Transcript_80674/g.233949 Transcript_80674/m.233949 type:complete len:392 (+) Transcript_80674:102-1277(+)